MTKPLDQDVKVLKACVRALDKSSNLRMLTANLQFIVDRYANPVVRMKFVKRQGGQS